MFLTVLVVNFDGLARRSVALLNVVVLFGIGLMSMVLLGLVVVGIASIVVVEASPQSRSQSRSPIGLRTVIVCTAKARRWRHT